MTDPQDTVAATDGDLALARAIAEVEFRNSHAAYEQDVAAVIARHRLEATQQAGWQDIASAPRDGTSFLAHDGDDRAEVVWFQPATGKDLVCADGHVFPVEGWCWATMDGPTLHHDTFEFWQPLPAAPSATRPAWVAAS